MTLKIAYIYPKGHLVTDTNYKVNISMIFRFSLYGFLKNQRYFEPFILLAFMQKGLSFAMIGLLIGFREICINIMEIPTGAVADVAGRKKSMILSFVSYSISFAIFGLSSAVWVLFESMGYEGLYKASKDYLQPILQTAALALPLFLYFDDPRLYKKVAVLIITKNIY